ncbi:hypothetical protein PVK06_015987 [Gossypium arboreum]|uniref:RNase H type-1 domain-containing protein n=1 Tax=Gossypium arboreum TaxID=29729 RepID=A0ABR0PZH0_GOSAR|nr:hypothetical protein PVK06_015987 [Gossypium arboreum]
MNQGECGWLGVNNKTKGVHRGSGGYHQVEIENNNTLLIVVIQNRVVVSSKYSEVRQVYEWCFKDWVVTFYQILRDNNSVVDCIAKEVRGEMEKLIIHVDPPKYVRSILEDDIHRVMHTLIAKD